MENYAYPFMSGVHIFDGLIGDCQKLSIEIFSALRSIKNRNLDMLCINVDRNCNFCQFLFLAKEENLMSFKIDIYDSQFDLFADGEEVFIQKNALPIAESLNTIKHHLSAEVEKIVYTSKRKKELRTEIKFWINGEVINKMGSVNVWRYIFSKKDRSTKMYSPWIEDK